MESILSKLHLFFQLVGRLNYYQGIERLTILEWLYSRRISPATALRVAFQISAKGGNATSEVGAPPF